jgi:hypothetical protein
VRLTFIVYSQRSISKRGEQYFNLILLETYEDLESIRKRVPRWSLAHPGNSSMFYIRKHIATVTYHCTLLGVNLNNKPILMRSHISVNCTIILKSMHVKIIAVIIEVASYKLRLFALWFLTGTKQASYR